MKNKLIGLFELITGIFGAIILIVAAWGNVKGVDEFFQVVLGVIMFGGVAYAGNGLLNNKKKGVKHSIIAQAFQVVAFQVSGMYYKFTGAAFLTLKLSKGALSDNAVFMLKLGNHKLSLLFNDKIIDFTIAKINTGIFSISIYLIPLILLLILLKSKK